MKINAIGVWSIRGILVIGMIVSGLMHNNDVSGGCFVGLVASFVFLDN